jgi:hypothetical protein
MTPPVPNILRTPFETLYADPLIKWKDSIKTVVGLAHPKKHGLDI